MKKTFYPGLTALLACAALGLTACGSDRSLEEYCTEYAEFEEQMNDAMNAAFDEAADGGDDSVFIDTRDQWLEQGRNLARDAGSDGYQDFQRALQLQLDSVELYTDSFDPDMTEEKMEQRVQELPADFQDQVDEASHRFAEMCGDAREQ